MAEKIMQGIKQISELIGQAVKKRVVCLYRVSTVGQVEKDDIPMQKQYCREFCRGQSGWEIVKEFSEKGVSGFKVSAKDRDAIQEIQKMALKGEFDILLVFMFDRLGRRDDETPFVVEWFVKQGIEVWSAMEGQQRFDTHVDKLLNYIRYWQASGESIKTSLRVKTRLEQLTQEGYYTGGRVPFGYQAVKRGRINKKNHEVRDLAIEPGEAEVMKIIFQKYVYEGYGALRLHRYLMDQGLRTKDGKTITMGIINRVIKNPICIGIIQKGESQSSVLPELKIIDEEVFARAQEIVRERVVPQSEVPLTTRGQSKAKLLREQYQQKQRDYQDLKEETLKVVRGTSRLNVDLLNNLIEETTVQMAELEGQIRTAEAELREVLSGAEQVRQEYAQLMDWAGLYDNCSFEAKKMIAAQFVKAVRVKRGYEVDIEFNVSFEEFQTLYLEPESEEDRRSRSATYLSLVEKSGQAG